MNNKNNLNEKGVIRTVREALLKVPNFELYSPNWRFIKDILERSVICTIMNIWMTFHIILSIKK